MRLPLLVALASLVVCYAAPISPPLEGEPRYPMLTMAHHILFRSFSRGAQFLEQSRRNQWLLRMSGTAKLANIPNSYARRKKIRGSNRALFGHREYYANMRNREGISPTRRKEIQGQLRRVTAVSEAVMVEHGAVLRKIHRKVTNLIKTAPPGKGCIRCLIRYQLIQEEQLQSNGWLIESHNSLYVSLLRNIEIKLRQI